MKAFRFRADRILEWRRVQQDAARVAFMRAAASVREATALVESAEADCARADRDYVNAMASPTDVGTLARYRNWIVRQRGQRDACTQTLEERRVIASQAGQVLQKAMIHVKVMERLRERAWQRYLEAERDEEMKTLDQLATSQFARRRTEEGADREY